MTNSKITLSAWQKKQATLLYHFASIEYLREVKERIDKLIGFSEDALGKAAEEKRDVTLRSARWGERNTSQNWGNNAWAVLADFQLSLAKDIANRAVGSFDVTGRNQCARAIAEYSMEWTTPDEQAIFDRLFGEANELAFNIDVTMCKVGPQNSWDDYSLAVEWNKMKDVFRQIPKFRVHEDTLEDTDTLPRRAGVYISADDPNATLQFAWHSGGNGKLIEGNTLNELGTKALAAVGRKNLWLDGQAMFDFVKANHNDLSLQADSFFDYSQTATLAPSLVARHAFTSKPCRWYFVEVLNGEFEDSLELISGPSTNAPPKIRFNGGAKCTNAGFYFTPARTSSRRNFTVGELFPEENSEYGATIWQFDERQE